LRHRFDGTLITTIGFGLLLHWSFIFKKYFCNAQLTSCRHNAICKNRIMSVMSLSILIYTEYFSLMIAAQNDFVDEINQKQGFEALRLLIQIAWFDNRGKERSRVATEAGAPLFGILSSLSDSRPNLYPRSMQSYEIRACRFCPSNECMSFNFKTPSSRSSKQMITITHSTWSEKTVWRYTFAKCNLVENRRLFLVVLR